jgi:hypothetical protein
MNEIRKEVSEKDKQYGRFVYTNLSCLELYETMVCDNSKYYYNNEEICS